MGKLFDVFRKLGNAASTDATGRTHSDEAAAIDVDEEALEFFNGLLGELEVTLPQPTERIEGLMNLQASPAARLVAVRLDLKVPDNDETRPLNEDELNWVVFQRPSIQLAGEADVPVKHEAPNGREFTIRDLARAIVETERQTRGQTQWLGGIDVHHCFFEGLEEREDGSWGITWGS